MTTNTKGGGLYQEVDILALIETVGSRSKVTQAKILQRLEQAVTDPKEYAELRHFILDEINDLTRAFVKETFGNIEFLIK